MLYDIAFIVLLILINAFFVGSEISLIAARKSHLATLIKKKSLASRALKTNTKNINLFITAMQVGNTLVSIAVGWRGQLLVNTLFPKSNIFTTVFSFLVITGSLMIFGELIPKKISMRHPEKYALIFAIPTALYSYIFDPIITFVNHTTDMFLNMLGVDGRENEIPFSEKELKIIISQSVKEGLIPPSLRLLFLNSLRLRNITAKQVMYHESEVVGFSSDMLLKEVEKTISRKKLHFLRYVVYKDGTKDVLGFFEVSDLLAVINKANSHGTLESSHIVKKTIKVSDNTSLDTVLAKMVHTQKFITVVYQGQKQMGIITINTILNELTKRFE